MNSEKIRIACVGNSITEGYGLKDAKTQSYPALLQKLLGSGFEVRNFGAAGATLQLGTASSYARTEQCQDLVENYAADIYIIELGTNDLVHSGGKLNETQFSEDYSSLIGALRAGMQDAAIFVCSLTPVKSEYVSSQDFLALQRMLVEVARTNQAHYIDIFSPLQEALESNPDIIPDGVHPSSEGAAIITNTVFWSIYPTGD